MSGRAWIPGLALLVAAVATEACADAVAANPAPSPAVAQAAADTLDRGGPHSSPLVPPGHWAASAARRLDEMGLAPAGYPAGHRRPTRREVARAVVAAAAGWDTLPPATAAFVSALRDRLEAEYPAAVAAARDGVPPAMGAGAGRIRLGMLAEEGGLLAGDGFVPGTDYEGPFPAPEPVGAGGEVDAAVHLVPHLAVHARGILRETDGYLPDLYLTGTAGPVAAWAGRRSEGYGPAAGGGLVLSDPPAMEGGGLRTADAFRLPGFLHAVGPVRLSASLRRVSRNRFEEPWLLTQRFSVEPHPRFRFAATRAMMFGGEGNAPVTFGNVWTAFWGDFGGEGGEFENQLASAEFLYRVPLATPVTAYLEYAFDDLSGGYWDTPAWTAGLRLPALPGAPAASAGVEWTHFEERCCGNPYWYRHFAFTRGWSEAGRILGHPLGGHGDEVAVHADALVAAWSGWVEARAYRRDRGRENLFAPTWEGGSWGASVRVEGRLDGHWEWVVEAEGETGDAGWSRERIFAGVGAIF